MAESVSKEDFDKLKEEVEHMKENIKLLANPEILRELEKAKKQIEAGNVLS